MFFDDDDYDVDDSDIDDDTDSESTYDTEDDVSEDDENEDSEGITENEDKSITFTGEGFDCTCSGKCLCRYYAPKSTYNSDCAYCGHGLHWHRRR